MDQAATQYLAVAEVARHLGMSVKTVNLWIKQGKVKAIQPGGAGGRYRIPIEEFQRLTGDAA